MTWEYGVTTELTKVTFTATILVETLKSTGSLISTRTAFQIKRTYSKHGRVPSLLKIASSIIGELYMFLTVFICDVTTYIQVEQSVHECQSIQLWWVVVLPISDQHSIMLMGKTTTYQTVLQQISLVFGNPVIHME